jgi:hypothetical protein
VGGVYNILPPQERQAIIHREFGGPLKNISLTQDKTKAQFELSVVDMAYRQLGRVYLDKETLGPVKLRQYKEDTFGAYAVTSITTNMKIDGLDPIDLILII